MQPGRPFDAVCLQVRGGEGADVDAALQPRAPRPARRATEVEVAVMPVTVTVVTVTVVVMAVVVMAMMMAMAVAVVATGARRRVARGGE